jgi:hypothetical protein
MKFFSRTIKGHMKLPPKRYQNASDPAYDPIRWQKWFYTLEARREKIPVLEAAYSHIKNGGSIEDFSIDVREMRDYKDFVEGRSRFQDLSAQDKRTYQRILDHAYDHYLGHGGNKSFTKIIYDESQLFGVNARHIVELWEVDPGVYPTRYRADK